MTSFGATYDAFRFGVVPQQIALVIGQVGHVSVTRVGRRLTPPTEAASIASIWFRNVWMTDVGGDRVFSEPTPSLSHLDQERPILEIQSRARLLKTSRRIAVIIFYGAHFPRNRADLRWQHPDTGAGSEKRRQRP